MARYRPEPAVDAPGAARDAVLLVNLGTPQAPTARAVRRYLAEFLSDRRVVEIPRLVWWPILYGIVLNLRPAQSARKYAQVWLPRGSPLAVHTALQAQLLAERLGEDGPRVAWAMRYGEPSVAHALTRLRAERCERIVVLPLYPQYAASTTASVMDAVNDWLAGARNLPQLRWVKHFHDHPAYIAALAALVRAHWAAHGRAPKLVMSFHGLPRRSVELGDPYGAECRKTAQLLASALALGGEEWTITFQSRFGRAAWLEPYTEPTLVELARRGTRRVDVVCPGFVADCLETLEEIGIGCKQAFLASGGEQLHLLPCLNESPQWIEALASIVREHAWSAPTA